MELIVYDWAGEAFKPIEEVLLKFDGHWDEQHPSSFIVNYYIEEPIDILDLIMKLNNAGLNVIVPKDFLTTGLLYVDTKLFTQR
jgi:hypothetical protein